MKTYILILIVLFFSIFIQAQVGIGTNTPNSSSVLELQSTSQGFLLPRMTKVQLEAIITPAKGLMVYCLDCHEEGLYVNIGDGTGAMWRDGQGGVLNTVVSSLAEVLEDSVSGSANVNGVSVSLNQIETTGVTGITVGNLLRYQMAIAAETGFSNPVTVGELQVIIDAVNAMVIALDEVLEDSASTGGANNNNGTAVTLSQLQDIELAGFNVNNLGAYQVAIAAEVAFSTPVLEAEIQTIITAVNAAVITAFLEVLEDSDSVNGAQNTNGTAVTFAQLELTAVINLNSNNLLAYQNAIQIIQNLSTPPTVSQIQNIINNVNQVASDALTEVLEDSVGGGSNTNGNPISFTQISNTGVTGAMAANLIRYQMAIAAETGFSNPVTVAELQVIIDAVNSVVNILVEILEDSVSTGGANNTNGNMVTFNQLQDIGVTGLNANNLGAYQSAIIAETGFSNPTEEVEVQSIITAVNAMVIALDEVLEDSAAGSNNANGIPVSFTQINNTGVTGAVVELLVYYQYDIAAETGFSNPPTIAEIQTVIDSGHDTTTAIEDVTTPTGRIWMDRNLGASQQAISISDSAAYGDLYQWGRRKDGHELRTNTNSIVGPVTATNEGLDIVINSSNWLTPDDNTRWNGATKGVHDPCPTGYRVPTIGELDAERAHFSPNNSAGAFASVLKLTAAGLRDKNDGSIGFEGALGWYTSGGTNTNTIATMRIRDSDTSLANYNKAYGFSVRCIKEL